MAQVMFEGVYKRGLAIGESDIKADLLRFFFTDPETGVKEEFEFPTFKAYHLARFNGYWYEAEIEKLRQLKREENGEKDEKSAAEAKVR